jgi:hypothetical protein
MQHDVLYRYMMYCTGFPWFGGVQPFGRCRLASTLLPVHFLSRQLALTLAVALARTIGLVRKGEEGGGFNPNAKQEGQSHKPQLPWITGQPRLLFHSPSQRRYIRSSALCVGACVCPSLSLSLSLSVCVCVCCVYASYFPPPLHSRAPASSPRLAFFNSCCIPGCWNAQGMSAPGCSQPLQMRVVCHWRWKEARELQDGFHHRWSFPDGFT